MPEFVGYMMLFTVVSFIFIFIHLMAGKLIRPSKPSAEKLTIYECGEPTIGSAWIQFDLRYYVVALLFVIFDVEVAFFFPWAVVFGKTNALANENLDAVAREQLIGELDPSYKPEKAGQSAPDAKTTAGAARHLGWIAFLDILIFFGVLLVGFAYLWKRGDINWVRSIAAEETAVPSPAGATGGRLFSATQSR